MQHSFDVVIVGGGPAGCACAYLLSGKGLKIALLEKETFPRDKICGDALSRDVVNQLSRIDPALLSRFELFAEKLPSYGVRFYSPDLSYLDMEYGGSGNSTPAGYISKRLDFDAFMFSQVKDLPDITVVQNCRINKIDRTDGLLQITSDKESFKTKMVVGADGAHSVVRKQLAGSSVEKKHHSAGVRSYFENVTPADGRNHIELHFYREVLPGYFWIFPLPGNKVNVGIGIPSATVSRKRINLNALLKEIISTHPEVKDRFVNARELEGPKGFGLPLGSKKRKISGDNFLLIGDAAGLIDPFTGEGIGNAIRSSRIAAEHLIRAFQQKKFDAACNKQYENELYSKIWNELRIGRSLQRLLKYPKLFDLVVRKARKNKSVRTLLTSMLDDAELKKELLKPSFYLNLLFDRGGGDNSPGRGDNSGDRAKR